MHDLFNLAGRRALITGSSQGIGLALATGLQDAGAEIVLNGRSLDKLESTAQAFRANWDKADPRLRTAAPGLRFVFLDLTQEQARERVAARPAHLFPVSLVASQFATLEDPSAEPGVLRLDATRALDALTNDVVRWVRGTAPVSSAEA